MYANIKSKKSSSCKIEICGPECFPGSGSGIPWPKKPKLTKKFFLGIWLPWPDAVAPLPLHLHCIVHWHPIVHRSAHLKTHPDHQCDWNPHSPAILKIKIIFHLNHRITICICICISYPEIKTCMPFFWHQNVPKKCEIVPVFRSYP